LVFAGRLRNAARATRRGFILYFYFIFLLFIWHENFAKNKKEKKKKKRRNLNRQIGAGEGEEVVVIAHKIRVSHICMASLIFLLICDKSLFTRFGPPWLIGHKKTDAGKRRKNVRPVDIYSNEVVVVVVVVVGESVGRPARRRLLVRKS
jgi:hypothetical protein